MSRDSVSVNLGNGLLATVGNLLRVGPVNVGFSNAKDTVAGLAASDAKGVSTTTKAGRYVYVQTCGVPSFSHHFSSMAMVTGLRCDSGCSLITSVPVFEPSAKGDKEHPIFCYPGRCIGSLTLAFPRSQCPALQDMYVGIVDHP